jgi:GT2 family glycosyltransferase
MPGRRTLSVVIPTFQRPDWIQRAVRSLQAQDQLPDEVVAIARDTDRPTHQSIEALLRSGLPFELRMEVVSEPGFLPPVGKGLTVARGDVVAVMDDDAEAADGWARRIIAHYDDATVGAVGGRCINCTEEGPLPVPDADRVGYVNLRGQFIGRMYHRPTFTQAVEVDYLMGGNMSYRREVARRLELDMALNHNAAQGYEVDLGLQTRRLGWKILFDPLIAIHHYSAPRAVVGMRASDTESAQWFAFNHARVALRRLPPMRGGFSFAYQLLIGERRVPGLLPMALGPVAHKLGFDLDKAPSALNGRLLAARSVLPT